MNKTHIVFLLCFLFVQTSCFSRAASDESIKATSCPAISEQTAVLIAKGELHLDYDLTKRDVVVTENESSWSVQFNSRCTYCEGGNPVVEVSKSDGKVLRTEIPK